MRMYGTITMDRPIDSDKHYISLGGFEFRCDDVPIQFDFFDYSGGVDTKDPRKLNFELRNLDLSAFPGAKVLLQKDTLKNIEEIIEFFVYTGEAGDPEIFFEKIDDIGFSLDIGNYPVPKDVIKSYNEKLKKERESQGITK